MPDLVAIPALPRPERERPLGRHAPRSRKGCWTCRERKLKCDETRPICRRCNFSARTCTYEVPQDIRRRVYRDADHVATPSRDDGRSRDDAQASPGSSGTPMSSAVDRDVSGEASDQPPDRPPDESDVIAFYKYQYLSSLSTKSPRWSFFVGVIHLGGTNSALMNILMANAHYRSEDRLGALEHYRSGLRDFASLVSSRQFDPLTLLGTLFLLVQFELRHAERPENIRTHLAGFNAAVLAHGDQLIPGLAPYVAASPSWSSSRREPIGDAEMAARYSNVLNRLGLWMTYMDAIASTWDLGGSIMDTFWNKYHGSHDLLYGKSRDALREIWGADYPSSEALDDLQNRPAFDLFHESHLLRYRISCFRWSLGDPQKAHRLRGEIQAKIDALNTQNEVLLDIASKWPQPGTETPRIVLNLRFIVPLFHALQVEFYRITCPGAARPPALLSSLSAIFQVAAIVYESEEPGSMCRLAWPMFVAGVEATDFALQSWVMDRFKGLADFGLSYRRAGRLLAHVIMRQRQNPREMVDYRKLIKERDDEFDAFIL